MFWSVKWFEECQRRYQRILSGKYRHWCPYWADAPMDETVVGFDSCPCFKCKCGKARLVPKEYPMGIKPILRMHENWFICPRARWYNFWKHDEKDFS